MLLIEFVQDNNNKSLAKVIKDGALYRVICGKEKASYRLYQNAILYAHEYIRKRLQKGTAYFMANYGGPGVEYYSYTA